MTDANDTPDTRPPHVRQADTTLSEAERHAAHLECWECNCHGFVDAVDSCEEKIVADSLARADAASLDPGEDDIRSGLAAVRYENVFGRRPDGA